MCAFMNEVTERQVENRDASDNTQTLCRISVRLSVELKRLAPALVSETLLKKSK